MDHFRAALRHSVTGELPPDPDAARALGRAAFTSDEAAVLLRITLDALAGVDRNANLTVLVDAWTALVEEPRLETASRR